MREMWYNGGGLSEASGAAGFRGNIGRLGWATRRIADRMLWLVFVVNVVLIAAFLVSPYKVLVVRSDSMEPALKVGSIVIAERLGDAASLRVGDIVTYKNPAVPFTITHRIIEVTEEGFVTKGDNLKIDDGEIPREWVRYRVTGCLSHGLPCFPGKEQMLLSLPSRRGVR